MSLSLLGKKSYTGINPFIASILIVFAEIITFNVLIFQNILIDYSFLFFLNYILIFIIPPHFLHIINYFLGDNGKPFSIKKLVHFIPLAISMVLLLWLCLQPAGFRHNFFAQINKGDRPLLSTILGIVFFLQFTIYVLIAYRKVFLYRKNNPETEVVKWLWIFINAVLFIIVFTYFFIFVFLFSISVILICCSASTIVLYDLFSFKSLKNYSFLSEIMAMKQPANSSSAPVLSEETRQKITLALNRLMEEDKYFMNSKISLSDLADQSNIPKYLLTPYLNQYHINFYEFINRYRIEEAKKMLISSDSQKYSVEVIAQKCGFNSRSVFYTAFKKNTGVTPIQFIKKEKLAEEAQANQGVEVETQE